MAGIFNASIFNNAIFNTGVGTDTHDDVSDLDRTLRRRDAEIKREREKLRADLLAAVERVTGKPPPLDAPYRQLAAIARKLPGFDYRAMLADIERIERESEEAARSAREFLQRAQQQADAARAAQEALALKRRIEQDREDEEALMTILLHIL